MTLLSVLIKMMDILIPRADRCVGFLLDAGKAAEQADGVQSCMYVLKESDKDAGDRLLSQLDACGIAAEQTTLDKLEALYKGGHGFNIMYKVPPMKSESELYDEVLFCGEVMYSRKWNQYMHNELLGDTKYSDLFAMPSCMLYNTKELLRMVMGLHDNIRPQSIVDIFGRDWMVLDTSHMMLCSELFSMSGTTSAAMSNSMVQIPWIVRLMLQLIRRRTYYVLVSLAPACRQYDMTVFLPVAPSAENMSDVACRFMLKQAAGYYKSLAYTSSMPVYKGLGVYDCKPVLDQVARMFNMIGWYVMKEDLPVKEAMLETNEWFSNSEAVMKLLGTLQEPGASVWYKRPLIAQPQEDTNG